ncbi:pr137 [rat cytomegalovirus strain Maastricht]|uniref:Pr137 n=1 Tax=Rat cytomegalovirus (strain Maastricht) TaxID=79700 RepID=Q9DW58_RCMVM|nr:pr137 [rat cytomegalovirus strain Maastricht]AAF99232.1 pr137 [rat cytomegalovirus strain Maastricht]WEG72051.1 membrane protein m137 [Murid betaherpesvirus 2]
MYSIAAFLLAASQVFSAHAQEEKPFKRDLSGFDFAHPRTVFTMGDEPLILNCSLRIPFSRGAVGWIRCSTGPNTERCHYLWKTFEGNSFVSDIGTYDDGRTASVSVFSRRTTDGSNEISTGVELSPVYENIGGHACFAVPLKEDDMIDQETAYATFLVSALVETRFTIRGNILRAHFSLSEKISPHVEGVTLLRVKNGPVVHFSGRLDRFKNTVSGERLSFSRIRDPEGRAVFVLVAAISETDVGFAVEMDNGRGGLIARSGVEAYGVRDLKAFEMSVVFLTLATTLTAVTFAVPALERPFALWCALCVGWTLRSVLG